MAGLPRLAGKEGWAERDRAGGGRPGPTAPGHRGSEPAPNGSSRSPPRRHGSGSASDWASAGGGPIECTTSRSGQLRVPSPTPLRPACPSERNGSCEAHRVDCVRIVSARHYVYLWADGVYLQARMEPQAECMLVLIGATPEGKKELVGFQVGLRESAQSWRELLVDPKARGLAIAPELATGDGALGFWKALEEVSPTTRHQRCTVHKTANVLDKLPKSVQPAARADLREIWQAPDRTTAETAVATFAEKYGTKYQKAVTCLTKDQEALLTFYDVPAEHWDHLRTSNPIESVFATVRHRTVRTKGALSQDTARLTVFKLVMAAARTWHKLKGENQLPKLIRGVTFKNGVEVSSTPAQHAA